MLRCTLRKCAQVMLGHVFHLVFGIIDYRSLACLGPSHYSKVNLLHLYHWLGLPLLWSGLTRQKNEIYINLLTKLSENSSFIVVN